MFIARFFKKVVLSGYSVRDFLESLLDFWYDSWYCWQGWQRGLQEISEELSQVYEACLHWGLRRSETACSLAAVSPQKTRQIWKVLISILPCRTDRWSSYSELPNIQKRGVCWSKKKWWEDKEKDKESKQGYILLRDWIKEQLGDKVAKVQIWKQVNSSPCVIVSDKFGWPANVERLMKSQTRGDTSSL